MLIDSSTTKGFFVSRLFTTNNNRRSKLKSHVEHSPSNVSVGTSTIYSNARRSRGDMAGKIRIVLLEPRAIERVYIVSRFLLTKKPTSNRRAVSNVLEIDGRRSCADTVGGECVAADTSRLLLWSCWLIVSRRWPLCLVVSAEPSTYPSPQNPLSTAITLLRIQSELDGHQISTFHRVTETLERHAIIFYSFPSRI